MAAIMASAARFGSSESGRTCRACRFGPSVLLHVEHRPLLSEQLAEVSALFVERHELLLVMRQRPRCQWLAGSLRLDQLIGHCGRCLDALKRMLHRLQHSADN